MSNNHLNITALSTHDILPSYSFNSSLPSTILASSEQKVSNHKSCNEIPEKVETKKTKELNKNVKVTDQSCNKFFNKYDNTCVENTIVERKFHIDPETIIMPDSCVFQRKEAEATWRNLLNKYQVASNSTWENAVKLLSSDLHYHEFKNYKQKKQVFNLYKIQKQKEEQEQSRRLIQKSKQEMEDVILSHSKISSKTKFIEANRLLCEYDMWTSIPKGDRRAFYEDLLPQMIKHEKNVASELREKNIVLFEEILNNLPDLTFKTTWKEALKTISKIPKFVQDKSLENMNKSDALICFEECIRRLEKQHENENKIINRLTKHQHRKNRDAFIEFLNELHKKSKLTSVSTWKDLFPIICHDERYHAMIAQPGSSPLDLFKFYTFDLKSRYSKEKKIIKEIINDHNFLFEINTTFESFQEFLCRDIRSESLDAGNIRMVYVSLIEKVIKKETQRNEINDDHPINNSMNIVNVLQESRNETKYFSTKNSDCDSEFMNSDRKVKISNKTKKILEPKHHRESKKESIYEVKTSKKRSKRRRKGKHSHHHFKSDKENIC